MSNQSATPRGWSSSPADDGWSPATSVRSGDTGRDRDPAAWSGAGPTSSRDQRATRRADQRIEQQLERMGRSREHVAAARPRERGLPWWAALLALIVIAAVGGLVDTVSAFDVSNGFNIAIVVASVVAILLVKRSHMFPIVIAPPIVYSAATITQIILRGGLSDRRVVFDAASNYLVYGFPAIAAATAAVLIIAGIRLITRK